MVTLLGPLHAEPWPQPLRTQSSVARTQDKIESNKCETLGIHDK